ncbi:MAG: DNA polymerase IV [Nitrososphaerales archaeon]|nr:DNA polymerase IV [Nitrososphaerales archaeon]
MVRVIGHLDLDYFYAQVEEAENPALKSMPVLVCVFSGRTEDSGVVATANYKAREFGVRSGMPIVSAKRKLQGENPVLIKMKREKYELVSERVMQLARENVDALEQTGIDEAFLDMTRVSHEDFGKAKQIAAKIKESVLASERLTCSIGVGRSKAVAKVASDFKKPDGLTMVPPESTTSFLNPLPVTKLYGVGPKTAQILEGLKITTVEELSKATVQELEGRLGRKLAMHLRAEANGQDDDPVSEKQEPTQLSRIITLKHDTNDSDIALAQLAGALEDLHRRLNSRDISFRTLTAIAILTDLSTKTKSRTFESPASDLTTMKEGVRTLLGELGRTVGKEFRRVGVRLSDLSSVKDQTSLTQFLREKKADNA